MIGQATFNHWVAPQHERLSETGNALVKYCDNVSILFRQPDGNIEFDNIGTYRHTKMHVHQSPRRSPDVHSYYIFVYFGIYITVRQPDGNLEFKNMHTSTYIQYIPKYQCPRILRDVPSFFCLHTNMY